MSTEIPSFQLELHATRKFTVIWLKFTKKWHKSKIFLILDRWEKNEIIEIRVFVFEVSAKHPFGPRSMSQNKRVTRLFGFVLLCKQI